MSEKGYRIQSRYLFYLLYYLLCANSLEYNCDSCGTKSTNPVARYTLSVNLVDSSGSMWISCFDKIGDTLVGKMIFRVAYVLYNIFIREISERAERIKR